jgi:hypothetical protein
MSDNTFEWSDEDFAALKKEMRAEQKRQWYYANREKSKERARAWRAANPDRHKALRKVWEERNPDAARAKNNESRWRKMGIKGAKQELYNDLHNQQKGLCAICGHPSSSRRLAWDHDHTTGQYRGLLCGSCNYRLGWLEKLLDEAKWFEQASSYLEKWEVKE